MTETELRKPEDFVQWWMEKAPLDGTFSTCLAAWEYQKAIITAKDAEITALRAKVKSQATELKNQAMAWSNVLDLDLIPQQHRASAEDLRRAAQEAGHE